MQRRFKLASQLEPSQLAIVREELSAMTGVEQVDIKGDQINLAYDLIQCATGPLEECLNQAGVRLGAGWSDREIQRLYPDLKLNCQSSKRVSF